MKSKQDKKQTTKIFVTKHFITQGIQEFEAELLDESPKMAVVRPEGECGLSSYYHGNQWHRTREAAVERAQVIRMRKIVSLEAQIEKLRGMHVK